MTLINIEKLVKRNKDSGVIKHCITLGAHAIVSKSSSEQELLNALIVLE